MLSRAASKFTPITAQAARSFAAVGNSNWGKVEMAPQDPIMGINVAFQADKRSTKQLLGIGAYRDNDGKPFILPCVTEAEKRILAKGMDHEYSGIDGIPSFRQKSSELAFGADHAVMKEGRVANCQSISGTGGLRLGFEFLRGTFPNKSAKVYVPDPSWPTHHGIAAKGGFETTTYRYYDRKTRGFDVNGMLEDLDKADNEQIVVLHSCAHNPTGQDPTKEQWKQILEVCKRKQHLCAFDSAY